MKDSFGPLLVVALLVGGAWFGVNRYMDRVSVQGASIPPGETDGVVKKEAKKEAARKVAAKRRAAAARNGAAVPDPQESPVPAREPITVVVPVNRAFPNAADLPPGTQRLQIEDRFGRPDIQATTVDRGALFETYLYHNQPDGRTLIVYLKDGRVQRARALP
jgi:hypothetical protein